MRVLRTGWIVFLFLALAGGPSAQSDDPFLQSLTRDAPIDRALLSRFVLGTATTLDQSREGIAYLRVMAEDVAPGGTFRDEAAAAMQERYDAYAKALRGFTAAGRRLSRDPSSDRLLFKALVAGQRTCWNLQNQINLAESYRANTGRIRDVLTAGTACSRFSHAIFQPKVEALIADALVGDRGAEEWARENRALREELAALEELLEDLRAIDAE